MMSLSSLPLLLGIFQDSLYGWNCLDKIYITKDLELARHNLGNKTKKVIPQEVDDLDADFPGDNNIPLLEWVNEDSEEEKFILPQSRKKKREQNKLKKSVVIGSSGRQINAPARRSKRTTPSVYRVNDGKEIPGPAKRNKPLKINNDRSFWKCRGIRKKGLSTLLEI